jgi:hypothetical protein
MSAIGKSVPASMVQAELESILEQASIMRAGLKILKQELQSHDIADK